MTLDQRQSHEWMSSHINKENFASQPQILQFLPFYVLESTDIALFKQPAILRWFSIANHILNLSLTKYLVYFHLPSEFTEVRSQGEF